jgi:hypothetical protein
MLMRLGCAVNRSTGAHPSGPPEDGRRYTGPSESAPLPLRGCGGYRRRFIPVKGPKDFQSSRAQPRAVARLENSGARRLLGFVVPIDHSMVGRTQKN